MSKKYVTPAISIIEIENSSLLLENSGETHNFNAKGGFNDYSEDDTNDDIWKLYLSYCEKRTYSIINYCMYFFNKNM